MRWLAPLAMVAVTAAVLGANLYIDHLATTQPGALQISETMWLDVWAVLGGIAWAPCAAFALYSLLRSPAGRSGGEG
ncbi:MAG: hypothetical protein DI555_06845 [Novosphingobium pentaromativorans]|uniref:Uncharacterized protein n=1 Tax=Novosphingobium pentaromativorans TaxID=205844 RepID=A0A2W5QDT6_9SPHN|nr:MAG: hypothetical protein DI555_06845 [Novosphingobium pentaromativorans]